MECEGYNKIEDVISITLSHLHQDGIIECNDSRGSDFYILVKKVKASLENKNKWARLKIKLYKRDKWFLVVSPVGYGKTYMVNELTLADDVTIINNYTITLKQNKIIR